MAAAAEQMVQNPSEEDDSSVDLDHLATQSPSIHTAAGMFTSKLTPSEYARSSNADDDEDESSDTSDGHLLETTLQAQPFSSASLLCQNSTIRRFSFDSSGLKGYHYCRHRRTLSFHRNPRFPNGGYQSRELSRNLSSPALLAASPIHSGRTYKLHIRQNGLRV